jgi:chaperonin GroES
MFQPLGNRVLVKRWPEVEAHESGLILPAVARELPQLGRVIAVGRGRVGRKSGRRCVVDIEVGDDVIFEKFVKTDCTIMVDGQELLLIPYELLYCVIEGGVNVEI